MIEVMTMFLICVNVICFTLAVVAYFLLKSKFAQYQRLNADFKLAVTSIHDVHISASQKITEISQELSQLRQTVSQLQMGRIK